VRKKIVYISLDFQAAAGCKEMKSRKVYFMAYACLMLVPLKYLHFSIASFIAVCEIIFESERARQIVVVCIELYGGVVVIIL
jgi:hypothetical protein